MKHTWRIIFILLGIFQTLFPVSVNFRTYDHGEYTRVVFEGDQGFGYKIDSGSDKLVLKLEQKVDFYPAVLRVENSPLVDRVVHEVFNNQSIFSVYFKLKVAVRRNFILENPFRLVFDLAQLGDSQKPQPDRPTGQDTSNQNQKTEQPAGSSEHPVSLKPIETICIDPGHGGEDLGAVGKTKALEKDITLKLGMKLKRLIESRLGFRVLMTRDKDIDVPLNSRAAIANNQQAQMFISIHVNSSFRKTARGSETYFVSLKATDQESMELAQKENQQVEGTTTEESDDNLQMILWNMAQTEYIRESSKLAEFIQNELNELLDTRNRGVKQAPFRVLMRTAMPAVLIEAAFVSNGSEEKRLADNEFLEKVALAIYNGVAKFVVYYNTIIQ